MENTKSSLERTHDRFKAKNALLVRSNKKVRLEAPPTSQCMEDTEMTAGDQKGTSFCDMLMGRPDESMQEEDEEGNSEEDEEQTLEEDQDQDCPIIHVSKEEKRRVRKPWKKTLIIKLLGCNICFHFLQMKLKEKWKPKSPL